MKATRRKGGAMKDSELYELELIAAAALRSLERDGLIESFIGDDGEVWWRHTAAGKKYFDLSRDSSYRAAERGEIPTIRIGRLLRVPVRAMERLLDGVGRTGDAA